MDLNFSFLVSFFALTWSLIWSWRREKKTVKMTLPAYHQRTFHRIECLFPRPGFCFSASFFTLLSCHSSVMLIVLFSFLVFQGFDHFLFFFFVDLLPSQLNIIPSLADAGATSSTNSTGSSLTTLSACLGWNFIVYQTKVIYCKLVSLVHDLQELIFDERGRMVLCKCVKAWLFIMRRPPVKNLIWCNFF